jgi:hypothetical protein
MSEQELYEIARQRIDRRNRRWTLWGVNLAVLLLCLGAFIGLVNTALMNISMFLFFAWTGVFVLHTIVLAMSESRDKDIEGEVAKLRNAVYDKPKRLELSDDGELVEFEDEDYAEQQRRNS